MKKEKKIFTVATAHLDTVWNWDFERTVSVYLKRTLDRNFRLFEKYPDYVFSFEGAYRYELMEEYYPEKFERLKSYVAQGRWCVAGSSYENGDVNVPSPEALFRNILYGNGYFRKTFGKESTDIFLPDCFGFGFALPAIAEHAGLKGFSTQKLTWGSAYGTPFDLGKWYGVNGKWIYASLNPHAYFYTFKKIRDWDFVKKKLAENEKYGLDITEVYHGTGDRGGAPAEKSVRVLSAEMAKNSDSDVKVLSVSSDRIFKELEESGCENLPEWKNELVMTNHAVGGYTSRAIGKRWNRKCEELADMAERAACAAYILGAAEYPSRALERAWKRAIAHQFHDDIPGTSVERAYKRSWNDYAVSINEFEREYEASSLAVAGLLDTSGLKGVPLVVSNSREVARRGVVTAVVPLEDTADLVADDGVRQYPVQFNDRGELCFEAELPAAGYKVYDLRKGTKSASTLSVAPDRLENERYVVKIDANGDVCSVYDKMLDKELLERPVTIDLFDYNGSKDWPAWELDYGELCKKPGHPKFKSSRVVDDGAARVSIEVVQTDGDSVFKTLVRLDKGEDAVFFDLEIEWESPRTLLKHNFALNVRNPEASYDLGLGVIKRGNACEKLYEVPAQKWADITDAGGEFGVSVLSECKYGWDKPADNVLRLTGIHTPKGDYRKDSKQSLMDLGLNRYSFALTSHDGSGPAETHRLAAEFTQPLAAFVADPRKGPLGREFSAFELSGGVILRALKLSQKGGSLIVRFNEAEGRPQTGVEFSLFGGIKAAKEVYANERPKGEAEVRDGKLVFDIAPYDVKTFELTVAAEAVKPSQKQIELPFSVRVTSRDGEKRGGSFGAKGFAVPAELLPGSIRAGGVEYRPGDADSENAVLGKGQTLEAEGFDRLALLCASASEGKEYAFGVGNGTVKRYVGGVDERLAGWDLYGAGETAFYNGGTVACEITHTHTRGKNDFARQVYLYSVTIDLDKSGKVRLPNDESFVLLAATAVKGGKGALVSPMHDVPPEGRKVPIRFKKRV